MKMKGRTLFGPQVKTLVIPRINGNIVFRLRAVLDFDDFDKLCPMPMPPTIRHRDGTETQDITDKDFIRKRDRWAESRTHWMILQSLAATPDLEWETINMADPKTWGNYQQEMKAAGLTPMEQARIVADVTDVCGLNIEKIDEATKTFLALEQKEKQGS